MRLGVTKRTSDGDAPLVDWGVDIDGRPVGRLTGLKPEESGVLLGWLDAGAEPPLWELIVRDDV
jgi:hypothetical protein